MGNRPNVRVGIRSGLVGVALVTTVAVVAPSAPAFGQATSSLTLTYGSRTPGSSTSMLLHLVYRNPVDPTGKPEPIRRLEIDTPSGTTFHDSTVPACGASNDQIQVEGRAACPPESEVAAGTLSAITGFGPPLDPVDTDAVLYNDGHGWIETFTDRGTTFPVVAIDRVTISGDVLSATPPSIPGGPPDFQTAVRDVDFFFPVRTGYIRTPPTCPPSHQWTTTARFGFADGNTQTATAVTPCRTGSAR